MLHSDWASLSKPHSILIPRCIMVEIISLCHHKFITPPILTEQRAGTRLGPYTYIYVHGSHISVCYVVIGASLSKPGVVYMLWDSLRLAPNMYRNFLISSVHVTMGLIRLYPIRT